MRVARAVIGANWGDEGKGLAVDALAARLGHTGRDVCVVRSNGGAQAGHGVERPDGRRHVFHHVGAGSLAGASTHLSRFFVAHPMMLPSELAALERKGARGFPISIDPRAPVTTPWDTAINQALEMSRGATRHGSTGLGFGETIERQENGPGLCAGDLWHNGLLGQLQAIRDHWLPARLQALGIDAADSPLAPLLTGEMDVLPRFLDDCAQFRSRVELLGDADLGARGDIVFEGAQGLQLDMDYGIFPHVTRSHTGLRNMLAIAAEAGIETIAPIYVTRAYATRHGAGPLPHETGKELPWAHVVDLTNAPNDWQGAIRQAPLDVDLLGATIGRDLALAETSRIEVVPVLGVTCLDQLQGRVEFLLAGEKNEARAKDLLATLATSTGLHIGMMSHGPCREMVLWSEPGRRCAA